MNRIVRYTRYDLYRKMTLPTNIIVTTSSHRGVLVRIAGETRVFSGFEVVQHFRSLVFSDVYEQVKPIR